MFDIGAMELFIIAIVALIVVGPKDLPRLLKTVGGFVRRARDMAAEVRAGVETLADEVEREADPFYEERKKEGITPEMTAEDITNHIMGSRASEMAEKNDAAMKGDQAEGAGQPSSNASQSSSDANQSSLIDGKDGGKDAS
jgi:sec-independent protein translocase protein TatB